MTCHNLPHGGNRLKLYAIERCMADGEIRYFVCKPIYGHQWTKSIAKASRYMNRHDCENARSRAIQESKEEIPFTSLRIVEC
jgi:uncharacterized protein YgiB involved in biofilm formation